MMRLRSACLLVVVLGVAGCSEMTNSRVATRFNNDAAVVGDLPLNPLQGRVITSWVDKSGTMSTMYGDDVAVMAARSGVGYPAGAVLSVVTWGQQEDPRWFGGRIPARPKMVEFVTVTGTGAPSYQRYEGSPLKKVASVEGVDPDSRTAYLLGQRAAVMP
jgi:hypothetical protein